MTRRRFLSSYTGIREDFCTYIDVLIAPRLFYTRVAERAPWALAFGLTLAVFGVATCLQQSAQDALMAKSLLEHARTVAPDLTALYRQSAEQVHTPLAAAFLNGAMTGSVAILLASTYYYACARLLGRNASYRLAIAFGSNSAALAGLTAVVNSIIVAISGTNQIGSFRDLAIPSPFMFIQDVRLEVALSIYNPINVWYYIEAITGLVLIFGLRRWAAISAIFVLSVSTASLYGLIISAFQSLV